MTVSVTMTDTRMGEDGTLWESGTSHDATEAFAKGLVQFGWATASFDATTRYTAARAYVNAANQYQLLDHEGGVIALSEAHPESSTVPTGTATTTVLTGAGEYSHYRCTVAAGNITIYDNTAASGKVLVPTTALVLGSYPVFGAGTNGVLPVTTGVTVVLSGAATVYIGATA